MATLLSIKIAILDVIEDNSYPGIVSRINNAINVIAGGIRVDGQTSPPLPELYKTDTVSTTVNAYADLPDTYQRNVFYIADSDGDRIISPAGGDYYSFVLFLNSISEKNLSESGSVYRVCVKGKKLYYQGIPSVAEDLTVMFYRLPVDISADTDEPDGIPSHLGLSLIRNYVCKEIFTEKGNSKKSEIYARLFYEAMLDLIDFAGIDAEPVYYKSVSDFEDGGICD